MAGRRPSAEAPKGSLGRPVGPLEPEPVAGEGVLGLRLTEILSGEEEGGRLGTRRNDRNGSGLGRISLGLGEGSSSCCLSKTQQRMIVCLRARGGRRHAEMIANL